MGIKSRKVSCCRADLARTLALSYKSKSYVVRIIINLDEYWFIKP